MQDQDYYLRRAEVARRMADHSANDNSRGIHRQLAAMYEDAARRAGDVTTTVFPAE